MMTVKFWRDTRFGASIERSGAACQTVTEIQLDSKSEAAVLPMTLDQRDEILASKKEIQQGLSIENTALEDEIAGWLKSE